MFGLVALLLLMAAFVFISLRAVSTLFDSGEVTPTSSDYAQWLGLWLPENLQNFQVYGEGWQDWLIEARFEMSASELPEFLERNTLQATGVERSIESSYQLEWFSSKEQLEVYEIVPLPNQSVPTSTGFYPTVWLDTTNPERVIVYIGAHDT
jgi:hypothetical protein